MKILVTGANGQLGTEAVNMLSENNQVYGLSRKELDVSDINNVFECVRDLKPDVILNAAAYTNVDGCEENVDLAYKINAVGAGNLASAALETGARLLHISTDFVFDGEKKEPYIEYDSVNPLSAYGKSKLAGDELVREICPRHYIIRTSWLYGHNGGNFVKTMLRLAENNNTLRVVDDQVGSPTYTVDLVDAIKTIISKEAYGIYHFSNNGYCSWNEFARKIFELSDRKDVEVLKISSEELKRPAKRPVYSVMRNYMLELRYNYQTRTWEDALREYLKS